ncbi:type II secretion system protein [Chloroflexota bacterium]
MRKNKQAGFTLFESIIVIGVAAAIIFAAYHFGWGVTGQAGEKALEADLKTMQKAVGAYLLSSNGLYPTDDGELPEPGEHKWIIWEASFVHGITRLSFSPDYISRLPRHWNEGVWWIDSGGKVSVALDPDEY